MPLGRRRSSVSAPSSSGVLDQPYVGSSGSNAIDSALPSPELQEEEDRKQAELDQQFFAPASPVNEASGTPAAPQKVQKSNSEVKDQRARSPSPVAPHETQVPSEETPPATKPPSQAEVPLPFYNPLPFDFTALEDYAAKEREALGLTTPIPVGGAAAAATATSTGPSVSFSPERASELRGRRQGDDSHHESGVKAGRMGRARKLSESVATPGSRGGRYQRKLALFEGSGPTTSSSSANNNNNSGTNAAADRGVSSAIPGATSRTPLMNQAQADKDYFGTMGSRPTPRHAASSHKARSAHGPDEKGSSYRFSFYSNALPTTVHTKFISELPNEGESFSDLFMGPQSNAQHQPPAHSAFLADPDRSAQASHRTSFSGGIGLDRAGRPTHALMRPQEDYESTTWWLDVLCPTDAEMKVLSKAFGIHPLTTEDIQMEESREKIELFRNYYFVCFRSFDQDPYSPTYLEPLNMYIVVFREGTLSFHFRGAPHPGNVRRRIKQLKDFINVSSDWISYALIDDITDAFGPLIQSIEYEVDSIDELVLILKEAEQSDMLRRIGTCRKKVMGLLRLIGQKADVVKGLAKRCNENWSVAPKSDIGLYLSDIQDHLVTMTQNLNHYEKILSRSHSNYLAQISIEMTDANNAINEVLSKLTALGTVLVPMNLITGLWGMNVRVPGQDVENLRWFGSIVAVLVAIAVIGGYATWRAIRSPRRPAMYEPTDEDQRFFGEETGQGHDREVAQELKKQEQERASHELERPSAPETPVYDDPTGSVFAGPANEAVPSSMSAYQSARRRSTRVHKRAGSSRRATGHSTTSRPTIRRSGTSRSSLPSAVSSDSSDEENNDPERDVASQQKKKSRRSSSFRRKSRDTDAASTTSSRRTSRSHVSAAAGLRGRRSSVAASTIGAAPTDDETDLGRPADAYDSDENPSDDVYGPYGSSVSSADSDNSSRTGAEGGGGLFLTHGFVGGPDPFFGDHRVDMEEDGDSIHSRESDKRIFDSLGGSITGSKQPIYFPDEDLHVVLVGWGPKTWKVIVWTIASVLTLGILPLLGRWLPHWWIRGKGKDRAFARATSVVAHTSHGDQHVLPIQDITFAQPVPQSAIFPPSLGAPPASREEANESPAPTSLPRTAEPPSAASKGRMLSQLRIIDYRYYRLLLHPDTNLWRMVRDWRDPVWAVAGVKALRRGPDAQVREQRQKLFGRNMISIEAKSVLELLLDECLHPFYCFQVASIVLWSLDDYMFYAATIFIISVISIASTLIETRANTKRMVEMSRFECPVQTQRGGRWTCMSSEDLVPGDLVNLTDEDLTTFPADLVLLSGEVIVNESMLTGESVPVSKTPLEEAEAPSLAVGGDLPPGLTKHVVFCGTKIVRVRPTPVAKGQTEAVGMVLRIGFNTTKGALVRSMLFPRPLGFKFYRDSFRFIGILSCVAGLGFLGSVTNFVKLGIAWTTILKRALDLITITCPPALPATMSIGTSFAINRLRKAAIYCISPNRVNVGGKTNLWVFDKTGTLTEEGLDVLGVRSVDRTDKCFSDLHTDAEDIPIIGAQDAKTPLLHALAACHALKLVDGELIGDPLDLRMFEFTKWSLEEGREDSSRPSLEARRSTDGGDERVPERPATLVQSVVRPPGGQSFSVEDALRAGQKHAHFLELGIIRTFDFVSSLRRMSVMVKKLKSKSIEVYCKGAPEAIQTICDKDTLPEDFDELLAQYTRHGFRIIALAAKSIPNLTWLKAQRMKREQAESGLRFLGLIVFENKLKPGTIPVINTLKHARIGARMCTGDNIRTAVSVGRECGIVPENARVYIPSFVSGDSLTAKSELIWTDVEDDDYHLDAYGLTVRFRYHLLSDSLWYCGLTKPRQPLLPDDDSDASSVVSEDGDWALAVSGDAFRWIVDYAPLETLQRMLVKSAIFARMSPDEKHELVDRLQALGYTVGFCGDGANDCGALKAADVGLSLSEAEASVAAPFTSRSPDISCVVEVIREGRAALVTSFSCFKYMALYSLIQFTTVTLLYSIASSLGDFQFLYIDLFIILPIAVTMGRTAAYPRIHPKAPTANLVSKQVLTSLGGQILLTSGFQLVVFFYVRAQEWYKPPTIHVDKLKIKNYENTALFLISSFQYILVAAVFCVGPPYRQSIPSNTWLLVTFIGLIAFSAYTLFATSGSVYKLLQLVHIPREFHLELALLVIVNCVLSYLWEKQWAVPIAKWMGRNLRRWRKKHGKVYKSVARDVR